MPACVTEMTLHTINILVAYYDQHAHGCKHNMLYFDHEKLDVYQTAIEFVEIIESIVKQFPRGRAFNPF